MKVSYIYQLLINVSHLLSSTLPLFHDFGNMEMSLFPVCLMLTQGNKIDASNFIDCNLTCREFLSTVIESLLFDIYIYRRYQNSSNVETQHRTEWIRVLNFSVHLFLTTVWPFYGFMRSKHGFWQALSPLLSIVSIVLRQQNWGPLLAGFSLQLDFYPLLEPHCEQWESISSSNGSIRWLSLKLCAFHWTASTPLRLPRQILRSWWFSLFLYPLY